MQSRHGVNNVMDVLRKAAEALQRDGCAVLATIVGSSGSTPAPRGSFMLIENGGERTAGTVGGGSVEAAVIAAATQTFSSGTPVIATFDLQDDVTESGLICGGTVDVFLEPLTREHAPLLAMLARKRKTGEDVLLAIVRSAGGTERKVVVSQASEISPEEERHAVTIAGFQSRHGIQIPANIWTEGALRLHGPEGEIIVVAIPGTPPLVVFGGGHIGRSVAQVAHLAGFAVTVVDDRPAFSAADRFPAGVNAIVSPWKEALDRIQVTTSTAVVIVTRAHVSDEEVLAAVLTTPASYIGMIGSKKKVTHAFEKLARRGVTADVLRRIHAPIGIDIGATTVEEIAVSIVAEVIAARRGACAPFAHKSTEMEELLTTLRPTDVRT
jgi:xanthine dehydrogenase accessory factor